MQNMIKFMLDTHKIYPNSIITEDFQDDFADFA